MYQQFSIKLIYKGYSDNVIVILIVFLNINFYTFMCGNDMLVCVVFFYCFIISL